MATAFGLTHTCGTAATHYSGTPPLDPLLIPFIHASDESRARAHLDSLIHHYADPVIVAAVRRHAPSVFSTSAGTHSGDGADLRSETIHLLLQRIGAIRYDDASPISDFLAYVKVTARHLCWKHTHKIRRERNFSSFNTGITASSRESDSGFSEIAELVASAPAGENVCSLVEQRGLLKAVWAEVCALPKIQRIALLYNFRDKNGSNALPLLALCSIATPTDIARALDIREKDVEQFFEQLPMEDNMIAALLEVPRSEIFNQRFAARRRLKRRVRAWLEPTAQE